MNGVMGEATLLHDAPAGADASSNVTRSVCAPAWKNTAPVAWSTPIEGSPPPAPRPADAA
jgi:hypothetical protein